MNPEIINRPQPDESSIAGAAPAGRRDPGAAAALLQALRTRFAALAQALGAHSATPGMPASGMDHLLDALLNCAAALQLSSLRLHDQPVAGAIRAQRDGQDFELVDCPPPLLRELQDELLRRVEIGRTALRLPWHARPLFWPAAGATGAAGDSGVPGGSLQIELRACPIADGRLSVFVQLRPAAADIPPLEALGLEAHDALVLRRALRQPQGLLLLAGPRGAGLTTTAYALLDTLGGAAPAAPCVLAVEAAAARPTPHWLQCAPVAPGVMPGVDPCGLTAVAPDVIFLDVLPAGASGAAYLHQATMAVAEGTLVVLALRAERALHTLGSLRVQGVLPADLAPHLLLVMAQRLVRRLCRYCAQPDDSAELRAVLARAANSWLREGALRGARAHPAGCAQCGGSGYHGRALLYELLEIDAGVRAMIEEGVGQIELEQRLLVDGRSIWDQGIRLLARGKISLAALRAALREPS